MIRLGLAAESEADARLLTALADRVLLEGLDWISLELLDAYRTWAGLHPESYLDLHRAWRLARERGLRITGHFAGEPGAVDAAMFRAALMLFAEENAPPEAVVLARDLDDAPERALGLDQARRDRRWPFEVLAALARPELEAWLIAAAAPDGEVEARAHAQERQRLGADPVVSSAELSSKREEHPRDAKRVLAALTRVGRPAEERWRGATLRALEENGSSNGLARFIAELREGLLPLFGAR